MTRRHALRDDQWERIAPLLPGREGHVGVTAKDNRLFVEPVLYRIPWRDDDQAHRRPEPEASRRPDGCAAMPATDGFFSYVRIWQIVLQKSVEAGC